MLQAKRAFLFLFITLFIGINLTTNAQTPSENQLRTFILEELATYTGKNGSPAYIAIDGVIYDVTNVPEWAGGEHNGFSAGKDLTNEIKTLSPHGVSKLEGLSVVGKLVSAETAVASDIKTDAPKPISTFQVLRPKIAKLLGFFNAALAIVAVSLFVIRRINRYYFANKNEPLKNILKPLSKIHLYVGIVLVITAFVHGYLALGTIFRVHTGPLAWFILLLMMLVAVGGKHYKIKNWIKVHRILAVLFMIAILLHIVARNII